VLQNSCAAEGSSADEADLYPYVANHCSQRWNWPVVNGLNANSVANFCTAVLTLEVQMRVPHVSGQGAARRFPSASLSRHSAADYRIFHLFSPSRLRMRAITSLVEMPSR